MTLLSWVALLSCGGKLMNIFTCAFENHNGPALVSDLKGILNKHDVSLGATALSLICRLIGIDYLR